MKELFYLHGILDEFELMRVMKSTASEHCGSNTDIGYTMAKHHELFQNWLDPAGRPVPYSTFREYMLEVLYEIDPNELSHKDIMRRFIDTPREAPLLPQQRRGKPQEAPGGGSELEGLMQELFRLQDLDGDGLLQEAELVQLNKKNALLHYGRDADLDAVEKQFREVFRTGLDPQGRPVPYATFREYMLQVLKGQDNDESAQTLIMEHFIAEAGAARAAFRVPSFHSEADAPFLPHLGFDEGVLVESMCEKQEEPGPPLPEELGSPRGAGTSVVVSGDSCVERAPERPDEICDTRATGVPAVTACDSVGEHGMEPSLEADDGAQPAADPGPPTAFGQRLEELTSELFDMHSSLSQLELIQLHNKVAVWYYGRAVDLCAATQRYQDLFQAWLDPASRQASYLAFRRCTREVFGEIAPVEQAQVILMQRFVIEARILSLAKASNRLTAQPHGRDVARIRARSVPHGLGRDCAGAMPCVRARTWSELPPETSTAAPAPSHVQRSEASQECGPPPSPPAAAPSEVPVRTRPSGSLRLPAGALSRAACREEGSPAPASPTGSTSAATPRSLASAWTASPPRPPWWHEVW